MTGNKVKEDKINGIGDKLLNKFWWLAHYGNDKAVIKLINKELKQVNKHLKGLK
jgi:hypothetical protein